MKCVLFWTYPLNHRGGKRKAAGPALGPGKAARSSYLELFVLVISH